MTLLQLKSELEEKEKEREEIEIVSESFLDALGCNPELNGLECPYCNGKIDLTDLLRHVRNKTEISALKKGISACEEILNSQKEIAVAKNDRYQRDSGCAEKSICFPSDTQTLINQALSQRNKEILEKIDLYLLVTKGNEECQKAFKELKQQLTNSEDKK